jgi:hypothetical protein
MKIRTSRILSAAAALAPTLLSGAPLAAAPDRLVVPLSDPAKPARLEVFLIMDSIHGVAGKAGEVSIGAEVVPDDEWDEDAAEPVIAGKASDRKDRWRMHRLPNNALDLSNTNGDITVGGARGPEIFLKTFNGDVVLRKR